ncbi:MAG: oligopeptidase A [Gammaproteobacteria bacterium]|nr:oligopeptidase A [Gammaproteobacteria bacterium]
MSNPLLADELLPRFSDIRIDDIEPALDAVLAENRARIAELATQTAPDWNSLAMPMQALDDRLSRVWSVVSHLNAVQNSDALREVYKRGVAKMTEYSTEVSQNAALCAAWKALAASPAFADLDQAQRQTVENVLRDFHLGGVDLPDAQKARYATLSRELADLSARFSDNVLDATQGWYKSVTDVAVLAGLPESALAGARQAAQQRGQEGYVITLDFPSYYPVMTYADSRALRREVYEAYVTRASDQGPCAGRWDNSALIDDILSRRHELAGLLGFASYAERSLAKKMAPSVAEVRRFLDELAARSRPVAERDFAELQAFARDQFGVTELEAWDVGYYGEKLRQHKYNISPEDLRPWFPVDRVVRGMFECVQRLFGVQIIQASDVDTWHPEVRVYRIERQGETLAWFYLDLYARQGKRGGAWIADCRVRWRRADGSLQLPVAFLTCNFTPPVDGQPALLTHDEVTTLFHEFGHGLHHMLTRVEVADVSGINGVAWDAVELPSQFMENWCWHPESIALISAHHQTGEPLPAQMLERLLAAKNYQSGMQMVRQLEFALFDFRLHAEYDPAQPRPPLAVLDEVRDQVSVIRPPAFNRFIHSFSHIFSGGYAAGYYSYKWAEVLSADAFSLFEERGIFDARTGQAFLQTVLESGGARSPMALFVEFRGREPQVDALLRHSGITEEAA